ncbi:carbohydrate ABC transporter permease [Gemmiger formicilis]|uniref:carbohydrate ABC transporter permease n=1 Tax=Gemmiger formicilis TaxID=745368 RepID=UPI0019579C58|nr:carbohydrate ABC transporter permease [Gemmiger formicilis]MBM6716799.1 carbohydrate ABC transporter permease [Gemmiger formicilis]
MGIKARTRLTHGLLYVFLTIFAVVILYPVVYVLCGSLKTNLQLMGGGSLLPTTWEFGNFIEVWEKANFAQYTFNSVFIAAFSTAGAVILSSMTAFCLARCDFPGRKILKNLYMMTMFIALGAVTLRPLYTLAVQTGLQNSLWPIILITIGAQGNNVFLVTKFVSGLPKELDEAAILDGCGPFRLYYMVLLPLLKPILATVALFQFRIAWNDYITSSVFTMTRPELRPLTVGVVQLKYGASAAAEYHLMMAGAAISIIPMLLVYLLCNRYFVEGTTSGSVKG